MIEDIEISSDNFLQQIPLLPGCYIFKDEDKKILYVGKSKSLRKRVAQYMGDRKDLTLKTQRMVYAAKYISIIIVDTETEALILENNLIKKYKPRYNILMKDDKRYAWIRITNDEFPKIERVREKKNDGSKYFGPYPSGKTIIKLLSNLRKTFPYRTCNLKIFENQEVKKSRLCIYYHINLCDGPCDSLISKDKYMDNINNIIKFLNGDKQKILDKLEKEMLFYSKKKDFEKAANLRDRIKEIRYVAQNIKVDFGDDEDIFIKNKKEENIESAKKLFSVLGIKYITGRIECYDISNIQGKYPVSSMVVFRKGDMDTSYYRKFKIRSQDTPNDPLMIYETIKRRITHKEEDESFSEKPDLIIIDGGKSQLNSALKALEEENINIPIIGLAKKREEIFLPNQKNPILLNFRNPEHLLIRRIRDEAHRFAITFHRKLRSKGFIKD
jgi:excinuclease ABC subunit C